MALLLSRYIEVLSHTPVVLSSLLSDLSTQWINTNEGGDTWTPKQVIAHLIVCEETNWLTRIKIILAGDNARIEKPIDMGAHFALAECHSLADLLAMFTEARQNGLETLRHLNIDEPIFSKTAIHPTLGTINLGQLIATWVTHDLAHIAQISRVMAKQQKEHVGPFASFLSILKDNRGNE